MSLIVRLPRWLKQRFRGRRTESSGGQLREFVYLDEVSVYSLLASLKGGITETFTDTASLNSELRAAIGVPGSGVDAGLGLSRAQSSQVVRKATVQTHFKELYELEQSSLVIGAPMSANPTVANSVAGLEKMLTDSSGGGWLVDPASLRRGRLIEVDVELDTDPMFRMSAVINTVCNLIDENPVMFDATTTIQLGEMRAVARVLDSLLEGLVPVRGRLVDYECAAVDGKNVLIHKDILQNMPDNQRPRGEPTYIVGVIQQDLFWKDIRRTLFSKPRYTMLCRLAADGLTQKWSPVATDLFSSLVPQFDEQMSTFSRQAEAAMTSATPAATDLSIPASSGKSTIEAYVEGLATMHGAPLDSDFVAELLGRVPSDDSWLSSVDGFRPVFSDVTSRFDTHLSVVTSDNDAYEARRAALLQAHAIVPGPLDERRPREQGLSSPELATEERFLESEITAIYW